MVRWSTIEYSILPQYVDWVRCERYALAFCLPELGNVVEYVFSLRAGKLDFGKMEDFTCVGWLVCVLWNSKVLVII